MTFIRGPVCRGQVAVDVIQDHFFVAFLDPDRDISVTDPGYLERTKELLSLPGEHGSRISLGGLWARYAIEQKRYRLLGDAPGLEAIRPLREDEGAECYSHCSTQSSASCWQRASHSIGSS